MKQTSGNFTKNTQNQFVYSTYYFFNANSYKNKALIKG